MAKSKTKKLSTTVSKTSSPVLKTAGKKKQLTVEQEFKIMLLVLDKFLWLGFGIMAVGLWMIVMGGEAVHKGVSFMVAGAVLLVIFMVLIVKEYEIIK